MDKIIILLILFLSPIICSAEEKVSCSYPELGTNIMVTEENCGVIDAEGLFKINDDVLKKINWSVYGMECAFVYGSKKNDGWHVINQSGVGRISSFWTDNSCAPFSEGLSVGLSNGKVIFYNQILEIVKHTNYTWASSFHGGFSKVCKGNLKKVHDSSGEHFEYIGGSCGYIDTNFKEVTPLIYPFEKTPEMNLNLSGPESRE